MTTYRVDGLTILATGTDGEVSDLNGGEPCTTTDELRDFVAELHTQGAYDADTRDALLAEVPTDDVTDEQIEALGREAAAADDLRMVSIVTAALMDWAITRDEARAECARVIAAALAQS